MQNKQIQVTFLAMFLMTFISACAAPADVKQNDTQTSLPVTTVETTESQASSGIVSGGVSTVKDESSEVSSEVSVKVIKDGRYTESASYVSPAQNENVEFAFTVKDGAVTAVELVKFSDNAVSKKFQENFLAGINAKVKGMKVSDIGSFDVVGGSSLTPAAFNQAVSKLKKEV